MHRIPIADLEDYIPEWMAAENVPGLSVAVIEDGRLAWAGSFGCRDRATGAPVTADTVFQAASLSKPIFAYAVLKWCAAGALDLNTPLGAYLPAPYLENDERIGQITARHVLSHTPGLPNWRPKDEPLHIHFTPGERFAYSGEGYVYLQHVVEHLSGQRLDAWMHDRLFEPMGMCHSSYVWTEAYEDTAARGHDPEGTPHDTWKMVEPNAAYSLHTTPSEYARLVALLLDPPDHSACLTPAEIAHMLTPRVPVNDAGFDAARPLADLHFNPHVSWGLGWGLQRTALGEGFWHWGDNNTFQAFVAGYPAQRSALVCMANGQKGSALWRDLYALAFAGPQPALDWLDTLYDRPSA